MNAEPILHEAAARIVALMVAAGGWIDDPELRALDGVDAFRTLAIDRGRFVELAQAYAHEIGSRLGETSWLRNGERAYVDDLLRQVTDPDERLLTCRLAAIAMAAGVFNEQRLLYEHMLASWHMTAVHPTAENDGHPR